jgi:hypothetical protein
VVLRSWFVGYPKEVGAPLVPGVAEDHEEPERDSEVLVLWLELGLFLEHPRRYLKLELQQQEGRDGRSFFAQTC